MKQVLFDETNPGIPVHLKKQRGISMMDAMLALAIGAVVLGAAFVAYKQSTTQSRNTSIEQALTAMVSGIQSKWSGLGSYTGITNAAVNSAGLVIKPLTYVATGTVIQLPDGINTATVASATPFNTFTVSISAIPIGGMCADLMSQMSSSMSDATVAGVDVFTSGAIDPTKVATNCADGAAVVMTFH